MLIINQNLILNKNEKQHIPTLKTFSLLMKFSVQGKDKTIVHTFENTTLLFKTLLIHATCNFSHRQSFQKIGKWLNPRLKLLIYIVVHFIQGCNFWMQKSLVYLYKFCFWNLYLRKTSLLYLLLHIEINTRFAKY